MLFFPGSHLFVPFSRYLVLVFSIFISSISVCVILSIFTFRYSYLLESPAFRDMNFRPPLFPRLPPAAVLLVCFVVIHFLMCDVNIERQSTYPVRCLSASGSMSRKDTVKTSTGAPLHSFSEIHDNNSVSGDITANLTDFKTLYVNLTQKFSDFEQSMKVEGEKTRDYVDQEVGIIVRRLEDLERKFTATSEIGDVQVAHNSDNINKSPLECIENCLVISGLHYPHEENQSAKVNDILEYLIPENEKGNIMILAVKRMARALILWLRWQPMCIPDLLFLK